MLYDREVRNGGSRFLGERGQGESCISPIYAERASCGELGFKLFKPYRASEMLRLLIIDNTRTLDHMGEQCGGLFSPPTRYPLPDEMTVA